MALGKRGALVRRRRDGAFDVRLRGWERDLLSSLVPQLREMLTAGSGGGAGGAGVDPVLKRLFPTAYVDDAFGSAHRAHASTEGGAPIRNGSHGASIAPTAGI